MRYQVGGQGWPVTGQHLVPPSTELNFDGKADHQLSPWERLALGKTPPLDAVSLDYDSALTLWVHFPDHRHLLRRSLDPWNQEQFEKFIAMGDAALGRWGR